jgi:hypothetical protein
MRREDDSGFGYRILLAVGQECVFISRDNLLLEWAMFEYHTNYCYVRDVDSALCRELKSAIGGVVAVVITVLQFWRTGALYKR